MTDSIFTISIGDELTLGQTVDAHAAWISQQLVAIGRRCTGHLTVADDQQAIVRALTYASQQANTLIVTGGLGPTDDDLTRQALADYLQTPLVPHTVATEQLTNYFKQLGRPMNPKNLIQGYLPVGTEPILNQRGTAPGIIAKQQALTIYCLPGVPSEMHAMFKQAVQPTLTAGKQPVILTHRLNCFGLGESSVAAQLGSLCDRDRNPLVGTTVSGGIVGVRVRGTFATQTLAETQLAETVAAIQTRLGEIVFGHDDQTLAEVVGRQLTDQQKTVATAESCTAGLLGKQLTERPHSSRYYRGGWISYANAFKIDHLNIDPVILETHGAVSAPVAQQMADAARDQAKADYALSITGIAGPSGQTPDKPVGTVYIALSCFDQPTDVFHHTFSGDRSTVRQRSALTALDHLRHHLIKTTH